MRTPPRTRALLDGQRFGRLTVLDEAPRRATHRYWRCRCDCGAETIVAQTHLQRGRVVSCGCQHVERLTRHGGRASPEYAVWQHMRQRCRNPNDPRYAHAGGRGITICPQWEDFAVFLRDMGPRPSPRHRLARRDADGDFMPENCVWATESERQRLQRAARSQSRSRGEPTAVCSFPGNAPLN